MRHRAIDRRVLPGGAAFTAWRAPDGWAYRRMDWPQDTNARARGSLLFAGGRGDFIEKYLEANHHWHREGWNVTAFDWRSQGGSRGAIAGGHLDSLDPLVDDLAALIGDWRAATPGPHVVVGHSMGGHIVLRTLSERTPGVDAAVLVAPMVMINSAPLPPAAAEWTAGLFNLFGWSRMPAWRQSAPPEPGGTLRQAILTNCPERYEDELWWWRKEPGFNLGVPSWGWLNAAYRSCARLTGERLSAIRVPVLFLATRSDRLVSADAIVRAHGAIAGAELVMFEGAGHEILREADEVRLEAMARIDSFLDRRAPRTDR